MEPAPPPSSKAPPAELLEIEGDEPGLRSSVVCPICQGSLSESQLASVTSFRCHVGHAFTTAGLLAEQAESLERALWAAVRTLEESASVSGRMATFSGPLRSRFEEKARTQTQQADVVRQMLLGSRSLTIVDGENAAAGSVQVASPGTKRPSPPRGRRKMEKKAKPASARTSVAKRVKRAAHRRRDRS
jgi:hypothetical protein